MGIERLPDQIEELLVSACVVPTDAPESDGTLSWDSTTVVMVEARAGGVQGLGYTYGSTACATFVAETLRDVVVGRPALDVRAAWLAMQRAVRNDGRVGEYFHDHVRIESLLFDGTLEPERGALRPDRSRPGLGLEVKRAELERYRA